MPTNYKKPNLKVGEIITLLGEDYEAVKVVDAKSSSDLFSGDLGELRANEPMCEMMVDEVGYTDWDEYIIYVNNPPKEPYCMDDFPEKPLYLVDILHWVDKKQMIAIYDGDIESNQIYRGRAEYLQYTSEGVLHEAATREVSWFETGNLIGTPHLMVYLKEVS